MKELLKELEQQEKELQFDSFSNEDAVAIGMSIYERAKKENLPLTVDITRNGQQLFHLAMPGTSPDNDQWIIRKCRLANRMQMSSFHIGTMLKDMGTTLEEQFYLSSMDYAAHGGCFPIYIKNTGMIGTITVSGLPQEKDHQVVVESIRAYLRSLVASDR